MLRKYCLDTGKDWDEGVPLVLFAVREAVQESLGFSPAQNDDCIDNVGSAQFVSILDLLKGYWQVPLTSRASDISAFVTPEDLVVYSLDWPTHVKILSTVFDRLENASLTLNLAKCEFAQATVTYLDCQHAFDNVKALLYSTPVLAAPDFSKPFKLEVDASAVGAGAVSLQEDDSGVDRPVCYFSRGSGCPSSSYTARYVLAIQRARLDQERDGASCSKAARRHLRGSLGSLVVVFSNKLQLLLTSGRKRTGDAAACLYMMVLQGKVAVVTGAAQGLGKGLAEILLQNGAKVALLDINEKAGKEVETQFNEAYGADRAHFYPVDVSSDQQFKDAFQKILSKFGQVDIFCNNAGILNEKQWEKMVSINLCGVVRGTYLALEHMKKENGGQGGVIINTASLAGFGPLPTAPLYTATKFGVVGFTRALAMASEMANYGVRINALCPAFIRTPLMDNFNSEEQTGQFFGLMGFLHSLMEKSPPLQVEEVTKGLILLVKDESLNGACLAVANDGAGLVSFSEGNPKTPVAL
ncbi:hypothetical protein AOLI_G00211230 [Acnodon oligacanthus]